MQKLKYIVLLSVFSFSFTINFGSNPIPVIEKIESANFDNLYKLNDFLYRSEQPSKKGMQEIENADIKTVLNLRKKNKDLKKSKNTQLKLMHFPIKTSKFSNNDIFESLKIIKEAEKPILIHCWYGSDRTGVIVAAYRMVFENWPKDKAIAEFTDKRFGYHKLLYPNVLELLESIDVKSLKNKLNSTTF
ncbi:dual specificity protein phosphatase family protein [Lutibacter sp. B1]|uniref:dual specificity protein phosphatase family protein n=1 Tax=Lutibacter sp. B1 TaxID=2725996 RepID=UPI0014570161|nr:dual specificity protein phosphatase family protein [Lutibacter sp. B1]NLP57278.1 dual specificity protein phosphatase family protein [Lutibacter sp. B1]